MTAAERVALAALEAFYEARGYTCHHELAALKPGADRVSEWCHLGGLLLDHGSVAYATRDDYEADPTGFLRAVAPVLALVANAIDAARVEAHQTVDDGLPPAARDRVHEAIDRAPRAAKEDEVAA